MVEDSSRSKPVRARRMFMATFVKADESKKGTSAHPSVSPPEPYFRLAKL
jgi:hypothetical protein